MTYVNRPNEPECPACKKPIREPHVEGCDIERCTRCKGQRLQCECADHDPVAAAWDGAFPGVRECEARGWFVVFTPDGWRTCDADTPDAAPDLNRLCDVYQGRRTETSSRYPRFDPARYAEEHNFKLTRLLRQFEGHPSQPVRAARDLLLQALRALDDSPSTPSPTPKPKETP